MNKEDYILKEIKKLKRKNKKLENKLDLTEKMLKTIIENKIKENLTWLKLL